MPENNEQAQQQQQQEPQDHQPADTISTASDAPALQQDASTQGSGLFLTAIPVNGLPSHLKIVTRRFHTAATAIISSSNPSSVLGWSAPR